MRVFKYRLDYGAINIDMPAGATLLTAGVQCSWPWIWALVDEARPPEMRSLFVLPTGALVPTGARYFTTFQVADGRYIFHVFEAGPQEIRGAA